MGEALVDAVGDGTVVVERGKDLADVVENGVDAHHVEHRFLLAGKGGVGQVFGRGTGAHGKGNAFGRALGEAGEVVADGLFQIGRKARVTHPAADFGAGLGQGLHVVGVQAGQAGVDALGQAVVGEEVAKGFGRGGKAAGHLDPGGCQLADHFAQRGVLAADDVHVGHAQLFEGDDQTS